MRLGKDKQLARTYPLCMSRLKIGVPKEFEGKKFEIVEEAKKQPVEYLTIKELSKSFGVQF